MGKVVAFYILGTVHVLVQLGLISWRIYKTRRGLKWDARQEKHVEGTHDRYTMPIFSFYVWEYKPASFHKQIMIWTGMNIAVEALIAITVVLGLVGIHKQIPMLVFIWAFGLAICLNWWIWWIVFLTAFSHFSVPNEVAYTVAFFALLFCAA